MSFLLYCVTALQNFFFYDFAVFEIHVSHISLVNEGRGLGKFYSKPDIWYDGLLLVNCSWVRLDSKIVQERPQKVMSCGDLDRLKFGLLAFNGPTHTFRPTGNFFQLRCTIVGERVFQNLPYVHSILIFLMINMSFLIPLTISPIHKCTNSIKIYNIDLKFTAYNHRSKSQRLIVLK